ncbi:methionine biosynthesis protein MetW [Aquaspirillum sp. LM1]|jgi:methionine biosynthesis protein MetW|uniref:methionine biosynthesis protein MetW n=1 Tax=Aquaspirillum sp. LM1 TaxID=1938604 RepID=UPI0009839B8E|nr:methionine biosynthesis protein MetW [Aquaspirillum sp. LM1]AQR63862.1 methionine biosynthesis protein MetW [Aquaspirillum sp. LM1]
MTLRSDLQQIADEIAPDARVLDLGCGDGALLAHLALRGVSGYGVEIDVNNVIACVEKGVDVIQGDLEAGLAGFADQSFDVVVLSQTIQAMKQTEQILLDMLRVGREAIVTFPNFGYWQNRWQIFLGRMPVSETIPYAWHNTPNLHLCMLGDFEALCAKNGIRVVERVVMDGEQKITFLPNLLGSLAFYRVSY